MFLLMMLLILSIKVHHSGLKNSLELSKTSKNAGFMDIDCKYYTASIKLKKVDESESKSSTDGADAIVICFDPNKVNQSSFLTYPILSCQPEGLKRVSNWLGADEDKDIPVRLLVCKTLPDNKIRTDVFKVAIDNRFEVIQLFPHPDEIEKGSVFDLILISLFRRRTWYRSNFVCTGRASVAKSYSKG